MLYHGVLWQLRTKRQENELAKSKVETSGYEDPIVFQARMTATEIILHGNLKVKFSHITFYRKDGWCKFHKVS